jgi:hypothetical protein
MSTPLPLETDPIDLLLGPDNDLVVTTDLQFTTGLTAIAQACRIALQMFQEEWFLDLDAGMPYWQAILGQKPDVSIPAAGIAARSELMSVPGVIDVPLLDVTYDGPTRKMTIKWQVSTAFGDTQPDVIAPRTPGAE